MLRTMFCRSAGTSGLIKTKLCYNLLKGESGKEVGSAFNAILKEKQGINLKVNTLDLYTLLF